MGKSMFVVCVKDEEKTVHCFSTCRTPISELRDIIDKGLIAVAQNDFQTAHGSFENALKLEPSNAMVTFIRIFRAIFQS